MFCRIIKAHYHHEQDHHFSPEKEDALHTDTKLSFLVRNFPYLFHFDHLFNEWTHWTHLTHLTSPNFNFWFFSNWNIICISVCYSSLVFSLYQNHAERLVTIHCSFPCFSSHNNWQGKKLQTFAPYNWPLMKTTSIFTELKYDS